MLTIRTLYIVLTLIFYLLNVTAECPEPCICSSEEEIDCSDSSMTTFPVGDWKVINMSHNSILNITNSVFRNNFVEVVDFSNNISECMEMFAFLGKLSVKEIDISWNNITYIYPETFLFTPNLTILSLANNRLLELQNGLMFSGNSLKILDISYCNISRIDETTIKYGVSNLEELYLQHNKIEYISNDSFKSLNNLKILNIGYNKLQSIGMEMFAPLSTLIEIRLENNPVLCDCQLGDIYFWCLTYEIKLENMTCVNSEGNYRIELSMHLGIIKCKYKYQKQTIHAKGESSGKEGTDSEDSDGLSPVTIFIIVLIIIVIIIIVCACFLGSSHSCCAAIGCGLICIECLQ
jgi:Leucine-rich repeat (LRR) protein